MRLHKVALLLIIPMLLAGGCSRLTFVKPKMERKDGEQIAPDYQVSDTPATKQRMAAQEQMGRALQNLQAGKLDAAEQSAKAVLKMRPDSADATTLMAIIEDRRGRASQAGAHYKRAAELPPLDGGRQNNYGAWLCANGYPAESLVWFDRALNDPDYATPAAALANAGGCAAKVGQYERSERDLRRALALDPRNSFALGAMAENEYRSQRFFEARAFVERRLAAAPASPVMLKLASQIEERLGDKVAASRYVKQLRAEFPDAVEANLGGSAGP
jgi:type IV pilus assembly protein PilF